MSTISNRHSVLPFVAGTSAPLSGQRLAKVGYKKTAAMPNPPASVCASVPMIQPADVLDKVQRLLPYIGAMLESAQDGILRSLYESSDYSLSSVSDDDISVDACISYLAAEAAGDRLKKDAILQWFDSEVAENLTILVAEKLGFSDLTPDAEKTVAKHVGIYRDLIGMLAGGKTILEPKQIRGCRTAISLASSADRISARLNDRLTAMESKKVVDILDL